MGVRVPTLFRVSLVLLALMVVITALPASAEAAAQGQHRVNLPTSSPGLGHSAASWRASCPYLPVSLVLPEKPGPSAHREACF